MSILPKPKRGLEVGQIAQFAQMKSEADVRVWITESRSIPDLLEFIAAQTKNSHLAPLAYHQIELLMSAATHEHIRVLRAPPIYKDVRLWIATTSGIFITLITQWLSHLFAQWLSQ